MTYSHEDIDRLSFEYAKVINKHPYAWNNEDRIKFIQWIEAKKEAEQCSPESTDVGESAKQR